MKITIPQTQRTWKISYVGDWWGDVVKTFNVTFKRSQGTVSVAPGLFPHTTNSDSANMETAFGFSFASINGTRKMWAMCEKLFNQQNFTLSKFSADTLTNSPTSLDTNSDILTYGYTAAKYDKLLISDDSGISLFNYDYSTSSWFNQWWEGDKKLISGSTNTSPIEVMTSTNHGFSTGDTVVIANHTGNDAANGRWVITSTAANKFTLDGSTGSGSGSGDGYVARVEFVGSPQKFLGQPALKTGVPHILRKFGNAPVLFITDKNAVHSVGTPNNPTDKDTTYNRLVFKPDYTINWCQVTSFKVYFGLKSDLGDSYPSLVIEYDPFNEQVREYQIDEGTTIGYIDNNIPCIVDFKGQLRSFNGIGFQAFDFFPAAFLEGRGMRLPHRNGITVSDKNIYFMIPSVAGDTVPGGIWVWEREIKRLYHMCSPKISDSAATSAGSFYCDTGAIVYAGNNNFLCGISVDTVSSGTPMSGVYSFNIVLASNLGYSRGYFVTAKIPSSEINTVFRNLMLKYNSVSTANQGTSTGSIVIKYRFADPVNPFATATGTWFGSNQFDTPTSSADKISIGDEIFVYKGPGSGMSAHVISKNPPVSGSVRVNLDENILASPPLTSFLYFSENWKRVPTTFDISDVTKAWEVIDVVENESTWVQFKIELRDFLAIEEMQVGFEPNLKVEKPQ